MSEVEVQGAEKLEIPVDLGKEQIRCLIANVYDLQKLRIGAGNRIVSSFYLQMGIKPGESSKDNEDVDNVIQILKREYKKITDMAVEKQSTAAKAIRLIDEIDNKAIASGVPLRSSMKKVKKGEAVVDPLKFIRSDNDYRLVDSYMRLLSAEEESIHVLDKYVKQHPMWEKFFKDIKGCGTLMSAVCIAYLNPYKARHVSSFYKYCGIDTVQDEDEYGNKLFTDADRSGKFRVKYLYQTSDGEYVDMEDVSSTGEFDAEGNELFMSRTHKVLCTKEAVMVTIEGEQRQVYENIETGEEYTKDDLVALEHGRQKGDTEIYDYVSKDGTVKQKRGITYNPVLKSKLLEVLSGCLLKAKDPVYSAMYYEYKKRLENHKYYSQRPAMHRARMANRFMIKQFLRNLWVCWREHEGLEVDEPYEVAKLGHKPHGYNQYQVDTARKSVGAEG